MSETLPQGWRRRSLAEMGAYENGFAFNDQHWSEEGLPIVRIAQITGSQGIVDRFPGRLPDKFLLASGDIIFSWSGTLAVVRWHGGPAWLNQHLFKVTPAENIDAGFLFHVLSESVAEFDKRAHGSTMKHIKRGELSEHAVGVPDDPLEQSKIAEVLDTLDAAIRGTEAVVAKLRAMKQGLLHDLLTRGIDANGDLRPPQPEAPHLYHQTPLGWLPKEWERARFVSKIDFPQGQVSPLQEPYRNWILIAPDHIESGTGRRLSSYTAAEQNAISGKYTVEPGDIVYSKIRPYLRKVILSEQQALCSADMYPLRPKASVNPRFLLGLILGEDFSKFAEAVSMRSGFPKINRTELSEYWCYWPNRDEQNLIAERLNAFDEKESIERAALDKLRAQKSGLMDDLLTGRVPVTPLL